MLHGEKSNYYEFAFVITKSSTSCVECCLECSLVSQRVICCTLSSILATLLEFCLSAVFLRSGAARIQKVHKNKCIAIRLSIEVSVYGVESAKGSQEAIQFGAS